MYWLACSRTTRHSLGQLTVSTKQPCTTSITLYHSTTVIIISHHSALSSYDRTHPNTMPHRFSPRCTVKHLPEPSHATHSLAKSSTTPYIMHFYELTSTIPRHPAPYAPTSTNQQYHTSRSTVWQHPASCRMTTTPLITTTSLITTGSRCIWWYQRRYFGWRCKKMGCFQQFYIWLGCVRWRRIGLLNVDIAKRHHTHFYI